MVLPNLRRFAYRQYHRSSWFDDVVQEVVLIVQQRIGQVRQAPAFASCLMRVVARLCMLPALRLIQSASDLTQAETWRELSHKPAHELHLDGQNPQKYREGIALAVALSRQCPHCLEQRSVTIKLH